MKSPSRVIGGLVALLGIGFLWTGFQALDALAHDRVRPVGLFVPGLVCLVLGMGTAAGNRWAAYALSGLLALVSVWLGVSSIFVVPFPWIMINLIFAIGLEAAAWMLFQGARMGARPKQTS